MLKNYFENQPLSVIIRQEYLCLARGDGRIVGGEMRVNDDNIFDPFLHINTEFDRGKFVGVQRELQTVKLVDLPRINIDMNGNTSADLLTRTFFVILAVVWETPQRVRLYQVLFLSLTWIPVITTNNKIIQDFHGNKTRAREVPINPDK